MAAHGRMQIACAAREETHLMLAEPAAARHTAHALCDFVPV